MIGLRWTERRAERDRPSSTATDDDAPLRAELFSVEELERHARTLAASHRVAAGRARNRLLARLSKNERVLQEAYDIVSEAVAQERVIEPAAEWLLDNYYLVEEQILAIRRMLPPSYSRELPHLTNEPGSHSPRAYVIALELIAHVDGRIEVASLNGFISAYQSVEPLKLGELWALPLMLRLALIENLRRVASRIAASRRHRDLAADWAHRILHAVEHNPRELILVLADMARAEPPLSGAFLSELTRQLHGQNPNIALATAWIDHRLAEHSLTIEQLIQADGQTQAADQVSIGNSISSLRFLNSHDWKDFVSQQSVVEQILTGDPPDVYSKMDFATRDRYRHVVEDLARRSGTPELEVAHMAVQLAHQEQRRDARSRTGHVGYFLVDRGRPLLERAVRTRWTPAALFECILRRWPLFSYLTVIGIISLVVTMLFIGRTIGTVPNWWMVALGMPALICASQLGIGIANWLVARLLAPQPLTRMDFEQGIPAGDRTLIAVPTMLTSPASVKHLLDGLEVRYLANRDPSLHFALLTDFADAASETMPDDAELVRLATEGISQLNEKYSHERKEAFFLFHRARRWNPKEGVWMGHERKRGKLADLNATLRGAVERFSHVVGDPSALQGVRYVITLDTDTQLPRNAARELVGTMSHPLNRPVFNAKRNQIVAGYTILQPRVDVNMPTSKVSRFVQLFGNAPGVDPYTRVVSDVYQDLFGEGSFIGKGIYDVDFFEQRCSEFPENTILSHDLIEGAYARAGLVSDVILYEDYPSRYEVDIARRHRWIRGDWQIAGWLLPRVPGRSKRRVRNPISWLSKWKIFDNLRRSLFPIAALALLLISWGMSPWIVGYAIALLLDALILPIVLAGIADLLNKPREMPWALHVRTTLSALGAPVAQQMLAVVFLPYEAYVSADAILRTLTRMWLTRRKLLEWRTASETERHAKDYLSAAFRRMWIAPTTAVALAIALSVFHPATWPLAMPFLTAWLLSPWLAWWLSRPIPRRTLSLSTTQRRFLETVARCTWRYFEEFVTAEDHWLPPDNIQLNPLAVVASRTSPTNIGMSLLAGLTAYDFGYQSAQQFITRTQQTLDTLERLERYRGHFLNWYDTRTLAPLHPRYVSTVDSGNLAANLLILASGCEELRDSSLLPRRAFQGIQETLHLLLESVHSSRSGTRGGHSSHLHRIDRLVDELSAPPTSLRAAMELLARLQTSVSEIRNNGVHDSLDSEVQWWAQSLERTCRDHYQDLVNLAPWLEMSTELNYERSEIESSDKAWSELREALKNLDLFATLRSVSSASDALMPLIDAARLTASPSRTTWLDQLQDMVDVGAERAQARIRSLEHLAEHCREFADMDFTLLYNKTRELLSIGYNVDERRLDNSYYDLLASEARLGSFVLIALGQLPQEHWFSLGRLMTNAGRTPALLSWSGSMFEYLMPLLVMPNYENTLLDSTYRAVVRRQIEYGKQRRVPWGISESGFNAVDQYKTYQYRAFGVPGLGLKRGLVEDLVIAPYASMLSLMVEPESACRNLERLNADGHLGRYGFYEAIDFTPSRLPPGATSVAVRQFMAHHQGMGLLSLAYLLLDRPMQRRFHADPALRAADLLLQERVPKAMIPVFPHASEASASHATTPQDAGKLRIITDPNAPSVELQLLSNGNYHVAITSAGGGYSRWRDFAVTRWREDPTRECHGSFCYLRDVDTGAVWSNTSQPTTARAKTYDAIFSQSRAEFRRVDGQIETYTQISVSPEHDIELRRVTLTNLSEFRRTLELTSYAEVVLAPQAQDEAHPAFSNLFVQTEIVPKRHAIYCTRRPRASNERPPWMAHLVVVRGEVHREPSYETDRMKFVGRQRTLQSPAVLDRTEPLSNTQGPVLDPIVSVRQTVRLPPNGAISIDIITGVADSREGVELLAEKYSDASISERVFDLAWTHGHVLLQQLGATETEAQDYARLAGAILHASGNRRAKPGVIGKNKLPQSRLWGIGVSGDLPIVLLQIRNRDRMPLVKQLLKAHAYWRLKGLPVDLVIWNEDDSVYRQELHEIIVELAASSSEGAFLERPGGVFIRRGEQLSEEDRLLLQAVARIVLTDEAGTLAEQVNRRQRVDPAPALLNPLRHSDAPMATARPKRDLAYFNGSGGFSPDGREYIMILAPGQATPAPWVNVIANSQFGTLVSEAGSAYTWFENCHEYRLTPWHNDPVTDAGGEAIYLRDEESARYWSPAPLPARGREHYVSRHGFGYTIFEYAEDGISTELCVYVDIHEPVKFCKLKVRNNSGRQRRLSATAYTELVLGDTRGKTLPHVVTEIDAASGAILARNAFNIDYGDRVAFISCSELNRTVTGDRREFLGRNGSPRQPAAMQRTRLSGRVGAVYDPCAAIQTAFTLNDSQERTISFTIGAGRDATHARHLAQQFRSVDSAERSIHAVWDFWSRALGVVYAETPDPSVNYLTNGWLVYQTLSCRMWARTGFYQSGGAYGFRDQLQDAMALVHVQPHLLRDHLLRAASRQFREGDVQHWWHPPLGRGVRTRISDDYLWLPLAICRYVDAIGDTGVLDEKIPYLDARPLREDEESNYDLPRISDEIGTLYEHGVRAIEHGLRFGEHGLPLMGSGDWNDGMNLVGLHGRGESVWLGFFLYQVLMQFSTLARRRGDSPLADRLDIEAGRLRGNIEQSAWDGDWYRRAYFDDGTPLGSIENPECQIDAISQSWSVLSGAGTQERSRQAMESVERRLVRDRDRLIQLLDPPFSDSALDPGYIKGYVPGVRENGGQYTHSAIWTVMAIAALGDHDRAWELFGLLNPISHGATAADIARYRVEPYVVAADVYGVEPHVGRGGWTWYTGSAGWMYRLLVESLLGLRLEIDRLFITPRLPAEWQTIKMHYRYRETFYHITVTVNESHDFASQLIVDGTVQPDGYVLLVDDRREHQVQLALPTQVQQSVVGLLD